jgi:hypothetical protein
VEAAPALPSARPEIFTPMPVFEPEPVVRTPPTAVEAVAVPAPVRVENAAPPPPRATAAPVATYALPPELVQIETSHDRVLPGTSKPLEPDVQPRRARRPRPSGAATQSEPEPLVQIETRGETSASE